MIKNVDIRCLLKKKYVLLVLGIELGLQVLEANVLTTTLPILKIFVLLKTKLEPFQQLNIFSLILKWSILADAIQRTSRILVFRSLWNGEEQQLKFFCILLFTWFHHMRYLGLLRFLWSKRSTFFCSRSYFTRKQSLA